MDFAIVSVRPCSRSCRTRYMRSALTLCLQAPFRRRVQLAGSTASRFRMSHEAHGGSGAAWLSAAREVGQLAVSLMPSCARSLRVITLSSLSLRLDSLDCYNAPICFGRIWSDASSPASSSSLTGCTKSSKFSAHCLCEGIAVELGSDRGCTAAYTADFACVSCAA
jgi:hypothetical protein